MISHIHICILSMYSVPPPCQWTQTAYIGRYLEYHSVCPLVWIGTPPSPAVSVYPPLNQRRGEYTRLRVRGWGSLNSDDWRKSLALGPHFPGESLAALSTLSCRGHIYLCDTITVYPVPNQTVCTSIHNPILHRWFRDSCLWWFLNHTGFPSAF